MKDPTRALLDKKEQLEVRLKEAEKYLSSSRPGSLHCERRGTEIRYYVCDSEMNSRQRGTYLKKDEIEVARDIARKKYCETLIPVLEKEIRAIDRLLAILSERPEEKVYKDMNIYRKRLVEPLFVPAEDTIRKWLRKYPSKGIQSGDASYLTQNGKQVRTKSERAIADELLSHGIPFKYECQLQPEGEERPVFPPFTVLNMRTGDEFFWEHLVLSETVPLPKNLMWRLDIYQRHGIIESGNLILTYETPWSPIDLNEIRDKIKEFLL